MAPQSSVVAKFCILFTADVNLQSAAINLSLIIMILKMWRVWGSPPEASTTTIVYLSDCNRLSTYGLPHFLHLVLKTRGVPTQNSIRGGIVFTSLWSLPPRSGVCTPPLPFSRFQWPRHFAWKIGQASWFLLFYPARTVNDSLYH